jgi:dTDP-4-amino-4,6-dideoxygalactose transaminase
MVHNSIIFQKNKSRIRDLCREGKTIKEISEITGVQIDVVSRNIKGIIVKYSGNIELGHKDGPYYETEEEMLHLKARLEDMKIFPRRYFYPSLNTLPYVEDIKMTISESIASRILCLPLYSGLTISEVSTIVSIINSAIC